MAASSRVVSIQLRTWAAASRAFGSWPSMLPLTSNRTATLIPAEIGAEVRDVPRLPAIEHLEVLDLEILNEPALLVADDCGDPNHVDAALEGRGGGWRLLLSSNATQTGR